MRAAFSSRRKTLANNLIQAFGFTRSEAEEVINGAGLDENVRGEVLSVEQFARLTERIKNLSR
ncbi:MAG: hypothetical protein J6U35_03750 [Clostridia bacterium]|nr:hypothetical protein [Clostridia bacterium]